MIGEQEFARLIATEDSFSNSDLQTIERLIGKYPYCQAFYYIKTAAFKRLRSEEFDGSLQLSSAYSADRELLFRFVEKSADVSRQFFTPSIEDIFEKPEVDSPEVTQPVSTTEATSYESASSDYENGEPTEASYISTKSNVTEPEGDALSILSDLAPPENNIPEGKPFEIDQGASLGVVEVGSEKIEEGEFLPDVSDDCFINRDIEQGVELEKSESERPEEDFNSIAQTELKEAPSANDTQDSPEDEVYEEISEVNELNVFQASPVDEGIEIPSFKPEDVEVAISKESSYDDELSIQPLAVAPVISASVITPGILGDIETVVPDLDVPGFNAYKDEEHSSAETESPDTAEIPQEKLIVDSIAAKDYFVFDRSVADPLKPEARESKEVKEAVVPPKLVDAPAPGDAQPSEFKLAVNQKPQDDISKYHDDTLPFTFLWWLHKTRKEYDVNYQPYISSAKMTNTPPADSSLNQQIIESIFHAQPELNTFPEEQLTSYSIAPKKREDAIIERFITEEPHIKPPSPNKLDTENKAKKSSEDNLDLVSETLAKIYIDQMLFHKAVDTYKKLSLKYPEKSAYFAAQISELEKKIN